MDLYPVVLFVHIVGAVLLFVALTVEGLSYRFGFGAAPMNRVIGPISAVLILASGLYMMKAQWGWAGWVVVGIVAWALIAVLGAVTGVAAMRGGSFARASFSSWLLRIGAALGVAFIMTVKPQAIVAVVAVLVGAALGGLLGLLGPSAKMPARSA